MIYNDVRFDPRYFSSTDTKTKELEKSYEISFILPGYSKENIEIAVKEDSIVVNAKSNYAAPEGYSLKNSGFSIKDKTLSAELPNKINRESISAKLANGILVVTMDKLAEQKKVITIND